MFIIWELGSDSDHLCIYLFIAHGFGGGWQQRKHLTGTCHVLSEFYWFSCESYDICLRHWQTVRGKVFREGLAGGGMLGSKYYKEILHSFSHKRACVNSMLTGLSHKKFTHIVSTAVWDFWRGFPSWRNWITSERLAVRCGVVDERNTSKVVHIALLRDDERVPSQESVGNNAALLLSQWTKQEYVNAKYGEFVSPARRYPSMLGHIAYPPETQHFCPL